VKPDGIGEPSHEVEIVHQQLLFQTRQMGLKVNGADPALLGDLEVADMMPPLLLGQVQGEARFSDAHLLC
jgi:hypothetical protein